MPNPPITVGELTDVPAPESPINAQFHQEVANRVVHRFATTALMNAWSAANGSLAFVAPTYYVRVAGAWTALAVKSAVDAADANLQAQINARPQAAADYTYVPAGHPSGTSFVITTSVTAAMTTNIISAFVWSIDDTITPQPWRPWNGWFLQLSNPFTIVVQGASPNLHLAWSITYEGP